MSIERFVKDLNALSKAINNSNAVELAARTTVARMSTRIFEEGKNSDNQDIAPEGYSTNPGVFSSAPFSNAVKSTKDDTFQPFKKPSAKGKKGYFGEFFQDGYKGFRGALGLRTDKVNLVFTGRLETDFNTAFVKVTKQQTNLALKNPFNDQKRKWSEDRYGNVFEATKQEQKLFADTLEKEIAKILP